jgi:LruC domain-containing protein
MNNTTLKTLHTAALRTARPLAALLLLGCSNAHALESSRLTDVIKSSGDGNIDVFNPSTTGRIIDGPTLEAFRQDNNGSIVFAVDVNEAADGSEKASSQAVTIDTARLEITIGGTVRTYTDYATTTRTLLARKGETTRSLYQSLLGDSGSNRITSNTDSDLYNSSFDSTLTFDVPDDVSGATAARLYVTLLDTNVQLGDPEAFYDYSNGFEDVALITREDAVLLDDLEAGQAEAPLVLPAETVATESGTSRVYYPSQSEFYLAAYEDLFPIRGDYDFNDLVVGYRVYVNLDQDGMMTSIGGEGYLVARGADYNHDWHLRIPLPASASGSGQLSVFLPDSQTPDTQTAISVNSGKLDVLAFESVRTRWADGSNKFVNTPSDQSLIHGHRFSFEVMLDAVLDLAQLGEPPFDPYLYVYNTEYEIHLADFPPVLPYSRNNQDGETSFRDANGYPFAMILPEDWRIPVEEVDLGAAYPQFLNFVTSGGNSNVDWYRNPVVDKIRQLLPATWRW